MSFPFHRSYSCVFLLSPLLFRFLFPYVLACPQEPHTSTLFVQYSPPRLNVRRRTPRQRAASNIDSQLYLTSFYPTPLLRPLWNAKSRRLLLVLHQLQNLSNFSISKQFLSATFYVIPSQVLRPFPSFLRLLPVSRVASFITTTAIITGKEVTGTVRLLSCVSRCLG